MSEQPEAPSDTNPPVRSSVSSEDASSVSTTSTRPATLAKPSGLKPPTKIGRLCSNSAPKPAIPLSPRTDGSTSETPRKLSEDSSRKHLSASSRSSVMSIEALWEKHPRRLSEAGLRRSSDHSVVLTEDTDSFIIGDRVWVGGTKPGQIAYIGETQFAPGDWAGIVLDDPIGKNDGSVAGHRYFQCPEKRGVFSRLTRLTREPLVVHTPHDASPSSDAGSVFERPPSGSARPRRTLSPNGSVRSMVSSKMNASISTTTNGDVRIGDRVIVSSSRGSKAGTLRYVGATEFAAGVWAGVELDDPLGKNDGSVDGKRYFECSPRFGLFAPISKVSRSPSNRKPGTCAIHSSNGRATPIRRSNSRESLTSLGTSIASSRVGVRLGVTSLGSQRVGPRASSTPVSAKNALQELLREKQHHLERLMRERELERSETAKASMQAVRAENALEQARKEAAQINSENVRMKAELEKINKMLEDERQKVEDLMFRNEEENINKEDYNKYRESMEEDKAAREKLIRELEAEVALQAARAETTAAALRVVEEQSNVEMAAVVEQHKEELAAAQKLQNLLDEAYALLKEKESEKDSLGKSLTDELTKVKNESEKALNEAKTKMTIAQTEFETQLSMITSKLQLAESKLETEKQNVERLNKEKSDIISDLNSKLTSLQAIVDDKTLELNKITGASKEHELNLNKEITKLKMELSAKIVDIEQLEDFKKKQESSYKTLQDEFLGMKDELTKKINEYETFLNEASQQDEKNKSDILKLQQDLNQKSKEYERLLNDTSKSSNVNEKLIDEYKKTIHERDKEIIKLKDDFEQTTANFNIKHTKIAEEHKKEIEDRNTKIEQLQKEIEMSKQALDQSKIDLDALNTQFALNNDELNLLREENKKLKQTINEITETNSQLKEKISQMELEIGELKRQLNSSIEKCDELLKSKEKIESECLNLAGQTTNSNEQFTKLSQHLKDTENELQNLKDKYRESANNFGRSEQELKQKLFKSQEDFSIEKNRLLQVVKENIVKVNEAENKIKEYENQSSGLTTRLNELEQQNNSILDENSILKKEIENLKIKEQDLTNEYDAARKKLEIDIDKYKEEISVLKADGATSEVKLMEKVDQLTEAQNDLNNKLEEARKNEDSLQKILEDVNLQLKNQKLIHEKDKTSLQAQLSELTDKIKQLESEEIQLKQLLEERQNNIKELTLKVEMLEVDIKSNGEIISEKDRQIGNITEELNKAIDAKNKLEENFTKSQQETASIRQQFEHLISSASAEESVVKEQLAQLESLRLEHAAILKDKTELEAKYKETSNEVAHLKTELSNASAKLNENIELVNNLKKSLEENKIALKSETEKNENITNINKKLQEDLHKFQDEISTKDKSLQDLQTQIDDLNQNLTSGTSETQKIINGLKTENNDLKSKHASEVESLNINLRQAQVQLEEKDKQLTELQSTKEKLNDLQVLLTKSEEDIKKLTNINDAQKTNYEDLNKQLQTEFSEYKKLSKTSKHELKSKIHEYEKELNEFRDKIAHDQSNHKIVKEKLAETEKKLAYVSQQLELLQVQQVSKENADERLEKLTLELQELRKTSTESLASSEKVVSDLKNDVERKIKDMKTKDELISKLQEEVKNLKAKLEIADREKVLLQKEMASKANNVRDKNDNTGVGLIGQGDTGANKLTEEKEMIDGQVSFLNSVIVDMQRKNEQLMARVQTLEGAVVPSEPVVVNGRKPRAVAPRLFCDICDVFDAHDTDDCPRQSQPDLPAQTSDKPRPPPRPYCDICEVFGHDTENCDEEVTF